MLPALHSLHPYLLSLLRIVSSLVLFSYGTQKVLHFPAAQNMPAAWSLSCTERRRLRHPLLLHFPVSRQRRRRPVQCRCAGQAQAGNRSLMATGEFEAALAASNKFEPYSLIQAPLRFDEATQASTKATPFTPSSTVG